MDAWTRSTFIRYQINRIWYQCSGKVRSWARLLKQAFDIDIEYCPQCGGTLKIIATIEDHSVITRILAHLGLPARAPPQAPLRSLDMFETA